MNNMNAPKILPWIARKAGISELASSFGVAPSAKPNT
jgi:hypothetical protein